MAAPAAPSEAPSRLDFEVDPSLDLPDPISLVPVVLAILLVVVGVWALAWLAWIP
jgi:hypothetical protein